MELKGGLSITKTLLIDLDDTLMPNQFYYLPCQANFVEYVVKKVFPENKKALSQAKKVKEIVTKEGTEGRQIAAIIKSEFGKDAELLEEIINTEVKLDIENVERFKKSGLPFSRYRFPTSFIDGYIKICEKYGVEPIVKNQQEIFTIGSGFWKVKPLLYENAEKVLDYLVEQKDELLLVSKGDEWLQWKKIKTNNLQKWFKKDNIHIVPDKDEELITRLIEGSDKKSTLKIGNSLKSDINPALEAGIRAVYIPKETWKYEDFRQKLVQGKTELHIPGTTKNYESFKEKIPKSDAIVLDEIKQVIEIYPYL